MIRYIQNQPYAATQKPVEKVQPLSAGKQIVSDFQQMFDKVNGDQVTAEQKVSEMVAGRNKDIPGTLIAMEKADVSLRMLMAIRNKIVNAYEEIMRMQV